MNAGPKSVGQTRPAEKLPLEGITVIELGMVMQVPLAGQMLGDLGADVVKIERLPPGEILRTLDPLGTAAEKMSCYYAALCRNKRTLSLDIKAPAGRDALLRIVDQADVVLHNFRPGVMERLGFDYDALSARNPGLVYAAGFAFGDTGPMAGMPGQDMLAQSFSGLARSGLADDEAPRLSNSPIIDYLTASSLTQGILAALLERQNSGRGQMVTTSLLDNAVATQILEVSSLSMHQARTSWVRHAMTFRTRDGWLIVLTLFRPNPVKSVCDAFGLENLSLRPEFATYDLQVENLPAAAEHFRPVVAQLTTAECVEKLSRQDVLCSPVNTLEEALAHPQIAANRSVWQTKAPGYGEVGLAANPIKLSRTPPTLRLQPTALGENSEAVLRSFGFEPYEIENLMGRNLVHSPEAKAKAV